MTKLIASQPAKDKKSILLISGIILIILLAGSVGVYFLGFFSFQEHTSVQPSNSGEHDMPQPEISTIFVDVPDMLVNLHNQASRPHFLKLRLALEIQDEPTAQAVRTLMPRLLDTFQLYLRSLTAEDLIGSSGMQRLKEDLGARGSLVVEPAHIRDVLIKEMLVQ